MRCLLFVGTCCLLLLLRVVVARCCPLFAACQLLLCVGCYLFFVAWLLFSRVDCCLWVVVMVLRVCTFIAVFCSLLAVACVRVLVVALSCKLLLRDFLFGFCNCCV